MRLVQTAFLLAVLAFATSCSGGKPDLTPSAETRPAAPRQEIDAGGGTAKRGPGSLYNACERIWCLTHERNFDLDHFASGHVGWILHDEGSGDVFVPKHRSGGPEFPHAKLNVLALCGKHVHPYWLGARSGPVTKSGYNFALGYDRAHFRTYGTRLTPCCVNAEAWGFLHAAAPREYRFGDRTAAAESAGSGWQKAFPARAAGVSGPSIGTR
jgi:hypothetical protein